MKRFRTVAALAAAASLAAAPAIADEYSGSILIGHPATAVAGGVDENLGGCVGIADPGIDGQWFDLQHEAPGSHAILDPDDALDADAWFYTASCEFINNDVLARQFVGVTEAGTMPSGAAYVVVDGYAGTGNFTLTITPPAS